MSVCPECNDAHLTQKTDKTYFECWNKHRFKLVKVEGMIACKNCAFKFDPLTHRVGWNATRCPSCWKTIYCDF